MNFRPGIRNSRSDFKNFTLHSRDFTSDFQDLRGFTLDLRCSRSDFKNYREFRELRDFRDSRLGFRDLWSNLTVRTFFVHRISEGVFSSVGSEWPVFISTCNMG